MAKRGRSLQQLAVMTAMLTQGLKFYNEPERKFKRLKIKEIGVPISGIPHKGHQLFEFTDGTIIYALNQANAQKKYNKLTNGPR